MGFFERPVERPEELFDREKELENLRRAISSRAMIAVLGARRVGKTSLIKVATHDMPRIYLDIRKFESASYITYDTFLEELRRDLSDFTSLHEKVKEYLRRVRGVRVFKVGVEFSVGESRPSFSSMLEALNEWAEEENARVVMVMDEVQELVKMRGYSILPSLAYAYDNLRNVSFVFAGSKVGMLYRFLRIDDASSPLYGRYLERVVLNPLSKDLAIEFLRKGFEEHGVRVSEDFLAMAVEKLDGIIGWLSFLGLRVLSRGVDESVINEVIEEASRIAVSEFCNFVGVMGTKRYVEILKVLGSEGATWSQIRRYLELRLGTRIYDSELSRLLRNLMDNGFVEKRGEVYVISDPILRHASKHVRC